MPHKTRISRRRFLNQSIIGGAAFALGVRNAKAVPQPAPARSKDKLRLVFAADSHARTEWRTPQALEQAAAAINTQSPDLVIMGGDLATDGFQSSVETMIPRWKAYRRLHDALQCPVHAVIGNHDLVAAHPHDGTPPASDPRAFFKAQFGLTQTYRSFEAGGYHFILLDSMHIPEGQSRYEGRIVPEQLEWIKSDLTGVRPATPVVLATHIPFVTTFYQFTAASTMAIPTSRVIVNSREVLSLFQDHRLVLVLQGHLHIEEVVRWHGTTFVTGGAVCGQWWRGPWHGTQEGFGVVTLHDGRADWQYIDYGWEARRPPNR